MIEGKQSFVLYHDIRKPVELLSDEERGKLFLALLDYSEYGTFPEFEGALQMAFTFIQTDIDRDSASWEAKRAKRREAGSMGGKQKVANQANATFAKQTKQKVANQAVPVPVPVPVPAPVPVPDNIEYGGKPPRAARFTPPSLEDVRAYCEERGNNVDPRRFIDHYEANGWMRGKTKIKDWRAAVRTWERRDDHSGGNHDHGCQDPEIPGITRL